MTLKEINRAAHVAWCPTSDASSLLALGGMGGFETSLDFATFDLSNAGSDMKIVHSFKPEGRFQALSWGDTQDYQSFPKGILAGGFENGTITIWNPELILNGNQNNAAIFSRQVHQSQVTSLELHPQRASMLASGGADSEVKIVNLERMNAVDIFSPSTENRHRGHEVTGVEWNRKVPHILASCSNSGTTVVWDLKQRKPVISFLDPAHRMRCSSVSWNPEAATQVVVAYDDDRNPGLQLWDLRNASYPYKETAGHSKGIVSIQWCPLDSNLMLSAGKDNRMVCWTFNTGNFEVFSEVMTQQWNVGVRWSPKIPTLFAASAHTDKVSVHSVQPNRSTTTAANNRYVPKWMHRPCGAVFGFGGKLVTFGKNQGAQVHLHVVASDPELIPEADTFEQLLASGDYHGYCLNKVKNAKKNHDEYDAVSWSILEMLFRRDRTLLPSHLGFDQQEIYHRIEQYLGRKPGSTFTEQKPVAPGQQVAATPSAASIASPSLSPEDAEKFFSNLSEEYSRKEQENQMKHAQAQKLKEELQNALMNTQVSNWSTGPELMVKESLLLADIPVAVEVCLKCGRMADALVLASCGGTELWLKTRDEYLKRQQDPFLKVVGCLLTRDFDELVNVSSLNSWQETICLLAMYSPAEQYPSLCEKLASRLENEKFDVRAAVLCYLAASNFPQTLQIWSNMAGQQGSLKLGLQVLVEKLAVLKAATNYNGHDELMAEKITQYSEMLANSGRLTAAMRYLNLLPEGAASAALRERIYNSAPPHHMGNMKPPPFPYQRVDVRPAPTPIVHHHQQQQQQHAPQQQMGMYGQQQQQHYGQQQPQQQQGMMGQRGPTPYGQGPQPGGMGMPMQQGPMGAGGYGAPQQQQQMQQQGMGMGSMGIQQQAMKPGLGPMGSSMGGPMSGGMGMGMQPPGSMGMGMGGMGGMKPPVGGPTPGTGFPPMSSGGPGLAPPPMGQQSAPVGHQPLPQVMRPGVAGAGLGGPPVPQQHSLNAGPPRPGPMGSTAPSNQFGAPPTSMGQAPTPSPANVGPPRAGTGFGGPGPMQQQQQPPMGMGVQPPMHSSYSQPTGAPCMGMGPPSSVGAARPLYGGPQQSTPAPSYPASSPTNMGGPMSNGMMGSSMGMGMGPMGSHMGGVQAPPVGPPPMMQSGPSTAPAAGAQGLAPGLPVPWPLPTATQQLGSNTSTTAQLNAAVQQASAAKPAPVGIPASPQQMDLVTRVFNRLVEIAHQQDGNNKKREDVQKKLDELYQRLSTGMVTANVLEKVMTLAQAVEMQDYMTANKMHVELSSQDWEQNKGWLMGIKRLLPK